MISLFFFAAVSLLFKEEAEWKCTLCIFIFTEVISHVHLPYQDDHNCVYEKFCFI